MSPQHSPIGTCPQCGAAIRSGQILIEYDAAQGPGLWAECPECFEVVDPE